MAAAHHFATYGLSATIWPTPRLPRKFQARSQTCRHPYWRRIRLGHGAKICSRGWYSCYSFLSIIYNLISHIIFIRTMCEIPMMLGLSKNRMFPSSCVNQHFSTFKENTPEIGCPSFLNQPISCQFHFVGYTLLHPRKCHQQKADFTPHKTADTSWSIYIYVYIYMHTKM